MKKENEKEAVKSPLQFGAIVKGTKHSSEIAAEMVRGFEATLSAYEQVGEKPDKLTITAYLAGFTATLKALGFEADDALRLTHEVAVAIIEKGGKGFSTCDCDNCSKK